MLPARFLLFGYISGSVLYARIFAGIFHKEDMIAKSRDQNPGVANAFQYGGFWCGLLTLLGDLAKGFFPVYLYTHFGNTGYLNTLPAALVIASPVIGHAFPLFYRFKGGKGITVTFGVLLGLLPVWKPVAILAALFILFSSAMRITPHFYRTGVTYICALIGMLLLVDEMVIWLSFLLVTANVLMRLHISKEKREKPEVKLLWMR